jgi:hypothetical protein
VFFFFVVVVIVGFELGLALARQAFYYLSYTAPPSTLFALLFFRYGLVFFDRVGLDSHCWDDRHVPP